MTDAVNTGYDRTYVRHSGAVSDNWPSGSTASIPPWCPASRPSGSSNSSPPSNASPAPLARWLPPASPTPGRGAPTGTAPRRTGWPARPAPRSAKPPPPSTAAERLDALPATKAALQAGSLTPAQAREITDAAIDHRDAEAGLLQIAERDSWGQLREKAKAIKCAGDDDAARHQRVHRHRSLHTRTEPDGTFVLELRTTVDAGAKVLAVVEAERERLFRPLASTAAVNPTPPTPPMPSSTSAPVATAAAASGSGSRAKVIVRIDHDAFLRGHKDTGETCEIAGLGARPGRGGASDPR